MKKLVDLLGTQYLADYMAEDVRNVLDAEKHLDLAGAKFTPGISAILTESARQGVILRNTESIEQDMILQENAARAYADYVTKDLPLPASEDQIVETIKYLEEGVVYSLAGNNSLSFPFCVLVQLYSPNIQIDLEGHGQRFFKYITESLYRKNLKEVIATTDNYTLFVGNAYCPVKIAEKDLKKEFYLETTGNITWEDLTAMYQILPSYFGVVKTQKDETLAPLWEPVVKRAMSDMSRHFSNSNITIKSFLGGE